MVAAWSAWGWRRGGVITSGAAARARAVRRGARRARRRDRCARRGRSSRVASTGPACAWPCLLRLYSPWLCSLWLCLLWLCSLWLCSLWLCLLWRCLLWLYLLWRGGSPLRPATLCRRGCNPSSRGARAAGRPGLPPPPTLGRVPILTLTRPPRHARGAPASRRYTPRARRAAARRAPRRWALSWRWAWVWMPPAAPPLPSHYALSAPTCA